MASHAKRESNFLRLKSFQTNSSSARVSRPRRPLDRRSPVFVHQSASISTRNSYTAAMERYRFHPDGALFYVTYSIVDWLPIFVSEAACKIVTESFNFCHRRKGLRINAYVIMPTHL